MNRLQLRRAVVGLVAAVALLVLSGCSVVVDRPSQLPGAPDDAGPDQVSIVGADDGPVDVSARNALADLETFWAEQLPAVFGVVLEPLAGGYFSVDPGAVDPGEYPQGLSCGVDPLEVQGNAFYCRPAQSPNADSISYDRAFLGELAHGYGRFIPALVMAHEFGHAVQARVGAPRTSIAVETQADCLAGAWTAWVATGEAGHTRILEPELDQLLRGYLLLRDPVGTGTDTREAHGSYFDRVSAFQEGFDGGAAPCRDRFGPDRAYTQSEFASDGDFRAGGNAPFGTIEQIVDQSLPVFWERAFTEELGARFRAPEIESFTGRAPACAAADADLVYCPPGDVDGAPNGLVAYDERELIRPAYEQLGDFAVVTAVAIPYARAAREQLGLATDDEAALRSAVCLTGWYGSQVADGTIPGVVISPGDLDESVQFLLEYGNDPQVLPDVELSGFQLVDLFRSGYLEGPRACGIGVR
ncbi:hypothetical protein [Geodermatophilus ruber]|uniref:Predicted metalloprotease n=1 Tax=Geodermatophilus ruber TaxID=504800 RepID=A0A1I4I9B7_9ACTN|nr:hypothetical protein [Geodermatophilus ruber]SFL50989.1 Predicted metalloprotease [Geodermatophilus ruber]